MEMLKDPRNAVATANLVGLIGSTAYFYKQMEAVRLDMIKINETLAAVVRKITEMEKKDSGRADILKTVTDQLKQFNERLEKVPTMNVVHSLEKDLTEIVESLGSNGIEVELSSASVPEPVSKRALPPARRWAEYEEAEPRRRPREEVEYRSRRTETDNGRRFEGDKSQLLDDFLIDEVRRQVK